MRHAPDSASPLAASPSAGQEAAPLPSASMIVLRPAPSSGFEVLLMERAAGSSSFAGALVFPGGKVEEGDEAIAQASGFDGYWQQHAHRWAGAPQAQQAMARLYGAALRETLEEVGLWWPAAAQPSDAAQLLRLRQALASGQPWQQAVAGRAPAASLQGLVPLSRWITPLVPNMTRKRFDTWFFVAVLPDGQHAQADGSEAQRLVWASPRTVLDHFARREIVLAPPQIMTLAHLSRFADADSLLQHVQGQRPYCVAPVSEFIDGDRMVCFPGDERHPERERVMPGPTRLLERHKQFLPLDGFDALFE